MVRYYIGDKVKIRSDLVAGCRYGNDIFCYPMTDYLGKIVTIVENLYNGNYRIDCSGFCYTNEMIEGKVVGNRVVRSDL